MIEQAITKINQSIEAGVTLASPGVVSSYGLCELFSPEATKKQHPYRYNASEWEKVTLDDDVDLLIYHRLLNTSTDEEQFTYPDDIQSDVVFSLRMVFAVRRENWADTFQSIIANLPQRIDLGSKNIVFAEYTDFDDDHDAIIEDEFDNEIDYLHHKTKFRLHAVTYTIRASKNIIKCNFPADYDALTLLYAKEISDTEILLTWSNPILTPNHFLVSYGIVGGGFTESVQIAATQGGAVIGSLMDNTEYQFRIAAVYGGQSTPFSNTLTATTEETVGPGNPEPWRFPTELEALPNDAVLAYNGKYAIRYKQGTPLNTSGNYQGIVVTPDWQNQNTTIMLTNPSTGAYLHGISIVASSATVRLYSNGVMTDLNTVFRAATRGFLWPVKPHGFSIRIRLTAGRVMKIEVLNTWEGTDNYQGQVIEVASYTVTDGFTGYGILIAPGISNRLSWLHTVMSDYTP